MQPIRRTNTLPKFTSVQANMCNHFSSERHLNDRQTYKLHRTPALAESQMLAALPTKLKIRLRPAETSAYRTDSTS